MLETLTQADWAQCLQQDFQVDLGGGGTSIMRLVSVTGFTSSADPAREAYSLVFLGTKPVLSQSIYTLKHDKMGALDIFLVPIGLQNSAVSYEAIFN